MKPTLHHLGQLPKLPFFMALFILLCACLGVVAS